MYNFLFFSLSLFLYHLLPFFSYIYLVSSLVFFHVFLPLFHILHNYFLFFSFILNCKVVYFSLSSSLLSYFNSFSSYTIFRFSPLVSTLTSSLSCILHPFPTLFPSVLLLFYANFSLSAIAILPWVAGVFAFTPAKAFVRELKCPAITRLAGSITCRVTQFLRGSLLSLSLTIRGPA